MLADSQVKILLVVRPWLLQLQEVTVQFPVIAQEEMF